MPDYSGWIAIAAIIGMAMTTYFTRAGGLFVVSRINPSPRVRCFLSHVPASILVAIIVPTLVDKGPPEIISAALTALVAILTRNLIASLITGLICVSLLRYLVFSG
ncbi:AzlD family protein [Desulfonatronovibrio hydrogenovorans]|uniref:AzlD family protein n=1 Tax=Desulfonatronovibrio hydrogenovorans TaxID=53245 RepID=UPI000491B028|nr:AzlD domain-containing protein [Desulfonatronovibrio hydrogenovorans]